MRLHTLTEQLELVRNLVGGVAVIVTGLVVLSALFIELTTTRVVVDPFLVSSDLDVRNAGTVSAALAHRYAGQLRDIVSEARSNYPAELASTGTEQQRVEAPGEYQAFTNAVRYVVASVGTQVTHVEGHLIVRPDNRLTLSVRIRAPRQVADNSIVDDDDEAELDDLIRRSGVRAVATFAPVTAAVYAYNQGATTSDMIRTAQAMLATGPRSDFAWAYTLWGFAKLQANDRQSAILLLRQALSYDPSFPIAHYDLGIALQEEAKERQADDRRKRENYESAANEFHLAARSESNRVRSDALRNKSVCLAAVGRYAEALVAIQEAIVAHNYYPEAFWQQGQILMKLKRISEARRWYERAWLETPSPDEPAIICMDLGMALANAGEFQDALQTLHQCQTLQMNEQRRLMLATDILTVTTRLSQKKEGQQ